MAAVWGVTMGLQGDTRYLSDQVIGWAVDMGLDCFRIQIAADRIWRTYSSLPSAWSWNRLDDAIYKITQAGMHAIYTVQGPPLNPINDPWYLATSEPFYMNYAYDMATYAAAVAARYNGVNDVISNSINYGKLTLYALEVGNEGANIHFTNPNNVPAFVGYNASPYDMYNGVGGVTPGHKAQPARDPYYYVPIIQQCATAIRSVNSVTRIGMGSMWWVHPGGSQFSGGTRGASRSNYHNFLDYLYLQGVMDRLSYINFHYYSNLIAPEVGDGQTVTIGTALADMIEVMGDYGDTTMPIWITEWNWQVPDDATEAEQNRRGGVVLDALRTSGRVEACIFYTLNDLNDTPSNKSSWVYNNGSTWVQRAIYSTFITNKTTYPTLYVPASIRLSTPFIFYGNATLDSGGLTTASKMVPGTGGAETSKQTILTGTNVYGEIWSQGNGGLATVASIPATPTGRGWIFYPGAGTFAAGNWSGLATFMAADWGGVGHTSVTLRLFKRSGGSYTSIGTIVANITALAKTTYTFAATSMSSVTTTATDGIYVDLWWWDNYTNAGADNPSVYTSSNAALGTTNSLQITTPAFTPLGTSPTQERGLTGISLATKALGIERGIGGVSMAVKQFNIPRPLTQIRAVIEGAAEMLSVHISGATVPVQQAGISFDQRLDDRAGGSFAVIDEDGTTYPLQERQQVELIDTQRALTLYRGFIDSIGEQALSPVQAQPALMRTVTLEDLRSLAEKRLCVADYTNWTAGNIAADLVRTRLEGEQIVANFAMRRDQDATSFGQGTLSGVQSINGYLELAQAGSDTTHVETTTAHFSSGTLSGVTATNNALQLTKYKAMRFSAYAGGSTGVNTGNFLSYWSIWQGGITINDNDYIDYYIWHSSESVEAVGGVDIICSDGSTLRDTHVEDQNAGVDTHPNASLQGWATDRWYYRKVGFPAALNGKSIKYAALVMEGDKEGYHCFYVRSLKLHSVGGTVRTTFFETSIQRIGFMRQIGYYKPLIVLRDVYAGYGSRTAPSLSLTATGIAGQSVISWSETNTAQSTGTGTGVSTEDRPKQVVVDTSIDNGDTWQTCENGKAIPSLPVGMDLTGKSMLVRQTLNVAGSNPELSPTLNECTLAVEAAYNSSKVDVSRSYAGSEMTDGTNSMCGYQAAINIADGPEYNDVSGLKMNGWRKDWNTGERVNHILYGNNGPFMGIRNGTLFLHSAAGGGDVHVRLQDAGTYTTFTIACTIRPPTNGNAGILYHTNYWGNGADTYGYLVYIQPNQIGLGKGTNNSSGGFTFLSYVTATLDADQWYRVKVVYSTSDHVHHVFVDDVEYVTHTDASYTSGGVGLRVYSANDTIGYFDSFGVSSNATLAQATRTAPSVPLSTAVSVGDSRIWWTENTPGSTSIDVQASIDGGSTYTSCTNGSAIPALTPGLSLSGRALLVKILLNSDSVAYTPTLQGISWQVIGGFSASGSRIAPAFPIDDVGTIGSSSVSWAADVPASGTLGVDSSLNGSSWSALSASGDPVVGLTEQGDCWWDTFDTDTHTSYTYTSGHWLWDTANSRLVSISTSDSLALTGLSTMDAEMMLISDRMDSLQLLLRNSANGHYDLQVTDNLGVGGSRLDFVRYTPGGGSVTLSSEHTLDITRGVYHVIRVIVQGAGYAVWFNGTLVYRDTDPSPLATAGSCGLWFNAGTSYIRDLAIRPLGQSSSGVNVYTRTRLTSTNPIESPKVKDLVACVRAPEIATGKTIPQTDWAYKKSVAEALDECAQSSQMGWRFNESYRLVMQPRDGQFAPFVLWQGEGGTIEGSTLPRISRQSPTYCNRYYVTGAVDMVEQTESKLGNGVDTSWALTYPIESVESISMNGQGVTVGIKDTDTGQTFSYTPKEKTITFETQDGANPPPNTRIDITYIARVDYRAMSEDTEQQAIVAALEGSSGIVEASENIDGLSKEAADALAQARKTERARLSLSLSLMSMTAGLAPGQLVTVVIPKHDLLDLSLLITSVSTQLKQRPDGSLLYWYTIEATTGPNLGSWSRALSLRVLKKGGMTGIWP